MKRARNAVAGFVAVLAIAGCETPARAPTIAAERALPGTSWVNVVQEAIEPAQAPRLEFANDGKLSGYTGCNRLSGSYVLQGDRLEIVAISTKRACVGVGDAVERRFLEVITTSPRFRFAPPGLTITSAKGERLDFREAPRSQ